MRAKDVMATNVATVSADMGIAEIAKLMLEQRIGAVPVVDADGHILGIVSESDLMHRPETGAKLRQPRWLAFLADPEGGTEEYVKTHGLRARDVMTQPAITVAEEAPLSEIAQLLEEQRIRQVLVAREGKLIGLISRRDLLHELLAQIEALKASASLDDQTIRQTLLEALKKEDWAPGVYLHIVVTDGVVHLWGLAPSEQVRNALRIAAENIPGVREVKDHLGHLPPTGLAP